MTAPVSMARPVTTPDASAPTTVPLSQLRCGQSGTICTIGGDCDPTVCHRLQLLGFSAGRQVAKIRQAPLGGPMVFRVCDVDMCLRRAQADSILVALDEAA